MITTGSKWYFGLGVVTLVLAAAYGWTTGGNGLGPLTAGYKGGVGDHFGYGVLLVAGLASLFLGFVAVALRDAEAEAVAQVAGTNVVPAVTPAGTSYWPAVSAFGVALVVVGLVAGATLFVFGLITLGIVLVEWTVQAWADRATGDPATNRTIRNRFMNPVEFPAAALLTVAVLVVSFSRVFLAVSSEAAVWVATGIAVLVLAVGVLIASRPKLGANVIVGALFVAAVAVIGFGVAAGVAGEREFHEHEPGGEGEGGSGSEGALAPAARTAVAVDAGAALPGTVSR
ncbi:MAG TPA: hypothetical protein VF743_01220 [Acidimicrobiales bacterium]